MYSLRAIYAFHIVLQALYGITIFTSATEVYDQHPTGGDPLQAAEPVHNLALWHSQQEDELDRTVQYFLRRILLAKRGLGDFDALNEIIGETALLLPDFDIPVGRFWGADVNFYVNGLECSNLSISNLVVNHRLVNNRRLEFDLQVRGLAFDCEMEWRYEWGFTNGNGKGQIYTSGNNALIQVTFESDDFKTKPPKNAYLSDCESAIQIDDIDTQGGLVAFIFNAIEGALRGTIETEANAALCVEADAIGEALIDLMLTLDEFIEPYEGVLPPEMGDPLYPESQLNVSDTSSLFDFSESTLFAELLKIVDQQLGELVDDPISSTGTGQDLGINKIIRSTILNEDREFVIDRSLLPNNGVLHDGEDILAKSILTLKAIRVKGLDTITTFDPLNAIGRYTISNSFSWKFIDIEVDMQVVIRPTDANGAIIASEEVLTENISIDFGIDNMNVDFAMMAAVDGSIIQDIPLGTIITKFDQLGPCIGGAVKKVAVSLLSATVGNLDPPKLEGFISPGIDRVISSTVAAMFEMYEGALLDLMPNIFQTTLRNMVNDALSSAFTAETNTTQNCRAEFNETSKYLNFPDLFSPKDDATSAGGTGNEPYGSLVQTMYQVIESATSQSSEDGLSMINDLVIKPLTVGQSGLNGTMSFPEPLVDLDSNLKLGELTFSFRLNVFDVTIENLDTLGSPLVLLRPIAPQLLNNTAVIGTRSEPLLLKTKLMFSFDVGGDDKIENELEISMEFDKMRIDIIVFLAFLEKSLMEFPIGDIGNIHCWLAKIPTPVLDSFGIATSNSSLFFLEELDLSTTEARLNLKCISCSSPLFNVLAVTATQAVAIDDLTKAMNDVLNWAEAIISGSFSQIQIDRLVANSQMKCPHSNSFRSGFETPVYDSVGFSTQPETQDTFLVQFLATVASLVLCVVVIMFTVRWLTRRRFAIWMETSSTEDRHLVSERIKQEEIRQCQINADTTSMVASSSIPCLIRILVPLVIIGNILLFLSGHLSLGAGVNVDLTIAGQPLQLGSVFEFTLASSILDMWEAGAKELAVCIAIFSGVWPYTKQILTMIMWFSPTQWVSTSRRGSILTWLDTLGKWSFVDIFVLIITLAAFRISIKSPDDFLFLPPDFYSVELLVMPAWGLYANMIAQILSQISSHFIIYYHRKIINEYEREKNNELLIEEFDGKRTLQKHSFERDGTKKGKALVVKRSVNIALLVLSFIVVALLLIGCSVNVFNVDNNGLVGILVEAGQDLEPASTSYSLFKIVELMFEQAMYTDVAGDYIGLGVLAIILIFTVLIAPIAQLILLLQRWFMPLNRESRNKNFVIIEYLQAWQYSEVFILSIVVTSWQLAPVSEFFLNDSCDDLEDIFSALVTYGVLDRVNAQCFRAEPSIRFGTWILIASAIVLALLSHFVCKAVLHEKQDEIALYYDNLFEMDGREEEGNADKSAEANDGNDVTSPIPSARFTDYYRCLLKPGTGDEGKLCVGDTGGSEKDPLENVIPVPVPLLRGDESKPNTAY